MYFTKVNLKEANTFFENYEHLGNCGLGVWHWAASEDTEVLGVVSFGTTCFAPSRGIIARLAAEFALPVYQLCRGGTVPTATMNTPSRIVSGAMRAFRSDRGDCVIVAYSDREYNEVGTIYQACNALYTGVTAPKNQSNYVINGKSMSGWMVRKRFGTRAMSVLRRIDPKVVKRPLSSKYRYIFVQAPRKVKARFADRLQALIRPYPRRDAEKIAPMVISDLVRVRSTGRSCLEGIGRTYN